MKAVFRQGSRRGLFGGKSVLLKSLSGGRGRLVGGSRCNVLGVLEFGFGSSRRVRAGTRYTGFAKWHYTDLDKDKDNFEEHFNVQMKKL